MTDTIKWFKTRAKKVLKAAKAGDEISQALIRKFRRNPDGELKLMAVQHCVAKDAGFNGWGELLEASDGCRMAYIDARGGRWL